MNAWLRGLKACLAFLLLVAAAPAARMSGTEQARIQAALDRGVLLFELDQAAWVTTDDLIERLGGRRDMPIKGWVVERGGGRGDYVVTYFGDGAAGPVAWYSGAVRQGKVVSGEVFAETARPALTAAQLRLKEAADVARAYTDYQPCTPNRFNLAIVPPAAPDAPVEAYLLSAQTERNVYPLGGHYLLRIQSGKVESHRRFMKSCMNLDTAAEPGKGAPMALVVAHLLDPTPTEIHVWVSMWMKKPIYVMTGKTLWTVEGPTIRLLERR